MTRDEHSRENLDQGKQTTNNQRRIYYIGARNLKNVLITKFYHSS